MGITAAGEILLVTVDGRGASVGMTLREATELMSALGAVDAMNLDGGSSTTFVTGGAVRNAPSGGSAIPVASALAIAPTDALAALLAQVTESVKDLLRPAR